MSKENQKDEFIERKNSRRKHIKNKSLDRRISSNDEIEAHRPKKENRRKIEEMRQDEIWEDWEEYGR